MTAPLGPIPLRGPTVTAYQPGGCSWIKIQKAAGQSSYRLTDLLTRPLGTGETARDTGDAHRGLRLVSETRRDTRVGGDARRGAHNPEVAGSNPAPATKARGPFSNRERASCLSFVNGFVPRRLTHVAPAPPIDDHAGDVVRGAGDVQLPLRCCARSSAINCR